MSSTMIVRVWEVLGSFEVARKAYERVLARPTTQKEVAKNVICILLWLETIIGVKVLQKVSEMAHDSIMMSQVIIEANAIYGYVVHGSYILPEHLQNIPTIISLYGHKLVDFRFFKFHKALVARGVDVIQNTVVPLVDSDHLHMMLCKYENDMDSMVNAIPAPELLEPFVIQKRSPSEDFRTAFIVFPDSPPLRAQQILYYFEQHLFFKNCIEHVAMEERREERIPKHGVVVFQSAERRDEVMCQETAIFFRVQGRDMWVQLYKPLY